MLFIEILVAFFWGLILAAILAAVSDKYRTGKAFISFALIFFLVSWVGGMWIRPFGFVVGGVYWLPILLTGLFFLILIAALTPPASPKVTEETTTVTPAAETEVTAGEAVISIFFWIFLIMLIAALIGGYINRANEVEVIEVEEAKVMEIETIPEMRMDKLEIIKKVT